MLKPDLCDYSDAYIVVKGKITVQTVIDNETNIHELLSASFQGVKRLFVLA